MFHFSHFYTTLFSQDAPDFDYFQSRIRLKLNIYILSSFNFHLLLACE